MDDERDLIDSHRLQSLAKKFHDKQYRDGYVASHTRGVLARQMRNFRGQLSQAEYASKIGKQKTVVARLENPAYGGWSVRTMLDIARKENVATLIRFVDFPTFLSFTDDMSDEVLLPQPYDQVEIDRLVEDRERGISYFEAESVKPSGNWTVLTIQKPFIIMGTAPNVELIAANDSISSLPLTSEIGELKVLLTNG
jgi:hypothetical protein